MQYAYYIDPATSQELSFQLNYFSNEIYKQIINLKITDQVSAEEKSLFEKFSSIIKNQNGIFIVPFFDDKDNENSEKYQYGTRLDKEVFYKTHFKKLINLDTKEVLNLIQDNYFIQENRQKIIDIFNKLRKDNNQKVLNSIIKKLDALFVELGKAEFIKNKHKNLTPEASNYKNLTSQKEKLKFLIDFKELYAPTSNWSYGYYRQANNFVKKIKFLQEKIDAYRIPDFFGYIKYNTKKNYRKIDQNIAKINNLIKVPEKISSIACIGYAVADQNGFMGEDNGDFLHQATIYPNLKKAISDNYFSDDDGFVVFEVSMKINKVALIKGKIKDKAQKLIADYENSLIEDVLDKNTSATQAKKNKI